MLKKFLMAFTAMFFALSLASCSTPAQPWDGTWTADGFVATVQDKTIEISIVTPSSESVYWVGTFEPASSAVKNEEVVSVANQEVLQKSLLGSQDAEKSFIAKDGKLIFNISMMGVKRTVELAK